MAQQISELVSSAMNNIKDMIDVNTIIGEPVETSDGTVIIPFSRVAFGFGAGGSEFGDTASKFGGGSGAGVSINPAGFLVVSGGNVRLIPVGSGQTALEKLVDYLPEAVDKVSNFISKRKENK